MNVLDSARVVIYRINKKGLEIFLVNAGDENADNWQIPSGKIQNESLQLTGKKEELIKLEPVCQTNGHIKQTFAIEGDWHEIPSIRGIIKKDVKIVKSAIKQKFPELEHGTYFAVKEAVKKVMPEEYACLKELKDILIDRNQAKYI